MEKNKPSSVKEKEAAELTGLGKYYGNAEKGVLVQVIPDEPTRFIHPTPQGLQ